MLFISEEKLDRLIAAVENTNNATINVADAIGISAIAISALSVFVAYHIFRTQQRTERRRYTAQLHDFYWSEDFKKIRESAFASRGRWKSMPTDQPNPLLVYLATHRDDDTPPVEWSPISRLLFFFSDLDRYIDNEIVDKDLAMEMFGTAQYDWFKDFIIAIRNVVEQAHSGSKNPPSWIARTKAFKKKIVAFEQAR